MRFTLRKSFQLIKILLKAKYIIKKPKQKKIIIFDYKGAHTPYYKHFIKKDSEVLNVLGEEINIYVLFKMIINFKRINLKEYIDQYINLLKPKFIFHNAFNIRFFEVDKKNFKFNFEKIFTQSELKNHHDYEEFLRGKKNLYCDYLFVWSEGMKKLMQKNISGKYLINGSFFNNEGPQLDLNKLENTLIFVSQYRSFKKRKFNDEIDTIRDEYHGLKFSWSQFYEADLEVALKLKKFCKKNNIKFKIAGTSIDDKTQEKSFFSKKLDDDDWVFLESDPKKRGIYLTSNAKFIVTIDSTLGYECFARGQRVCFFSIRPKYLNSDYAKFGWPLNLPDEGLCWTTQNTNDDFDRLTNFLVFENDNAWNKIRNETLKDLVFYNNQNYIYKNFLIEKGLCSKDDLTD